jgi:hypothetical protein
VNDFRTITVGITGLGGSGKTALADILLTLAKVRRKNGLAETSTPIVPLAEFARLHLLNLLATGRLTNHNAYEHVLRPAAEWLDAVTENYYGVPQQAFDKRYLTEAHIKSLEELVASVRRIPAAYQLPVTVENKSSTYRPLLTAISVPLLHAASLWLRNNGRNVTNIWPHYARHLLDDELATHPFLALQILGGLLFPGDDKYIRDGRDGVLVEIQRPGLEQSTLVSEQRYLVPDFVVVNDGSLDDLAGVAAELWRSLRSGPSLWPEAGQAVPLYTARSITI